MMTIGSVSEVKRLGTSRGSRLEELYTQHISWAESLAFLLTRDAHLAEDLAQEAFIRVAGRLRHIRRPEAFRAYLRRAVVNGYRGHFRRLLTERAALEREAAAPVPSSDSYALAGETTEALTALPPRQRAAIVLRYYEDLSEEQTADLLRCSKRAVNALVSRALETLRGELGRDE